ncbi:MAG: hypothetical protein U0271_04340 [Polyangiaceae bacterium]
MTNRLWAGCFAVSLTCLFGCGDDAGQGGSGAANTGAAGGAGGGSEQGGNGGTGSDMGGSGGAGGGAATASWQITSNMVVNEKSVQDDLADAVARHTVVDGQDYVAIILTDFAAFCPALASGDCGTDSHFRLELDLVGAAEGSYSIADGQVSAWVGDVPQSCAGVGIGADSGSITFSTVELGANGFVDASFDLTFINGTASGTVHAPLCED